MKRIAIALAVIVAFVVAGFVALDAGIGHDEAVALLGRATGRAVTIGAGPRLALAWPPRLVVTNVTIGNLDGGSRPVMTTIGRAEAVLDVGALLGGRIVVGRLALDHADVLAETVDGEPNWIFRPAPREAAAPGPAEKRTDPNRRLAIRAIDVTAGHFAYRDAENAGDVDIDTLNFRRDPDPRLTAKAVIDGTEVTVEAGADAAGSSATATIRALGAALTLRGNPADGATDIALAVPDLAALSPLAGRALPAWHDIAARGHVRRVPDGWSVTELSLDMPQAKATGQADVATRPRLAIRGTLESPRLDIDALRAAAPEARAAPPSASAAAPPAPETAPAAPPNATQPRPDWPDRLRRMDTDIAAHIDTLIWHGQTDRAVTAHAVLANGVLTVAPLSGDTPAGHADATARVDASGDILAFAATIRAPEVPAAFLADLARRPGLLAGPLQVEADLKGRGDTPRAVRASADGHIGLAMVGGQVNNVLLETTVGNVLRLAHLPDLAKAKGRTEVRCFAARMDIADGIGTLRALALETPLLDLSGGGTVGLATGALAIRLQPTVRLQGVGGLSVPLIVGGTLADPDVRADAGGAAREGEDAAKHLGLVLGALGANGRIAGGPAGPDCPAALALARDGMAGPAPPPETASSPDDLLKRLIPGRKPK